MTEMQWLNVLLTPAVLLVSATCATFIGWQQLSANRKSAKQSAKRIREAEETRAIENRSVAKDRETMRFLFEYLDHAEHHQVITRIYNSARAGSQTPTIYLKELAGKLTDENKRRDRKLIIDLLNDYEFMAVGLRHQIYNEEILKECMRTIVIRAYSNLLPYINELKNNTASQNAFCELGDLVKRWLNNRPGHHVETFNQEEINAMLNSIKDSACP